MKLSRFCSNIFFYLIHVWWGLDDNHYIKTIRNSFWKKSSVKKTFKPFRLFFCLLFLYFPCLMTVYIHWVCYGTAIHILINNSNTMKLFFFITDIRKCILIYICNDTSSYQGLNMRNINKFSHMRILFIFCVFIVRWIKKPLTLFQY